MEVSDQLSILSPLLAVEPTEAAIEEETQRLEELQAELGTWKQSWQAGELRPSELLLAESTMERLEDEIAARDANIQEMQRRLEDTPESARRNRSEAFLVEEARQRIGDATEDSWRLW